MYSFEKFDSFLFIDILAILDENCYSQLIFDPCYPGHLNGVNDILAGGGKSHLFLARPSKFKYICIHLLELGFVLRFSYV